MVRLGEATSDGEAKKFEIKYLPVANHGNESGICLTVKVAGLRS